MNILHVAGLDFGGCAYRLMEAVNECTDHNARLLTRRKHSYGYPFDIVTRKPAVIIRWAVGWASVVNCFTCGSGVGVLKKTAGMKKMPRNLIISYVGTPYWSKPGSCHKRARMAGAKLQLVLGAHLATLGNHPLLPIALPAKRWRIIRDRMQEIERPLPIVMQTPSVPKRKYTAEIRAALSKRKDIDFRIVTGVSHRKVLVAKAKATLYVGPFGRAAYGLSGLEAMAMGIPLLTRATDPKSEAMIIKKFGYLPYYSVPPGKLSQTVTMFLDNPDLITEYSIKGKAFVDKFHDYPVVAEKYIAHCQRVMKMRKRK